ncbi:hypothetical protein J3R83DRAFT_8676, partial [Lanmaoa asiatica]
PRLETFEVSEDYDWAPSKWDHTQEIRAAAGTMQVAPGAPLYVRHGDRNPSRASLGWSDHCLTMPKNMFILVYSPIEEVSIEVPYCFISRCTYPDFYLDVHWNSGVVHDPRSSVTLIMTDG